MQWKALSVMAAVLGAMGSGCEYFEPAGPPAINPSPALTPVTQDKLGVAGAYVVGASPERLASPDATRQLNQALLASLDAETHPVGAATVGRSGLDPRAAAAVDSEPRGEITGAKPLHPGARSEAHVRNERLPSTSAATAATADLNHDGFLTLDEVVALSRSHLAEAQIIDRIRATGFVLATTAPQRGQLREFGVPEPVIAALR